ncbi:NRDE family protein [Desulfovermiculus halophilus]|uniref:NRDE family protein n=1 Tax=Desulfovermiculus halophilus TaxID=339722 RepID=UPI0006887587|nr:NRDE family protein [Desulfovermiculus halophilus]
MCLMVMAVRVHPDFPLILAANRDEFDSRGSRPAQFWPEAPQVLAGRDHNGGGTWLGVNTRGRLAMVTNVRDPKTFRPHRPSRGKLPVDYLLHTQDETRFWSRLSRTGSEYNGFNLVFGSGSELHWFSNAGGGARPIPSGIHGLSNAGLNTPWPKVIRARAGLWALLHSGRRPGPEELFALLADTTRVPDRDLPDTGVGLDMERILAPICVHSPGYGTQVSTLVFVHRSGRIDFWEKDVRTGNEVGGNAVRRFRIKGKQ